MYWCKLINKGRVVESFFREAGSLKELKEGLAMFQWPKGEWEFELSTSEYDE